jgi:hypothetical protein
VSRLLPVPQPGERIWVRSHGYWRLFQVGTVRRKTFAFALRPFGQHRCQGTYQTCFRSRCYFHAGFPVPYDQEGDDTYLSRTRPAERIGKEWRAS